MSFRELSPNPIAAHVTLALDPALARAIFWIAVASCAVAQILIVRAAARTPRDGEVADGIPRPTRAAEVGWTVLPGIVLAIVFLLTWRALPAGGEGAADEAPAAAAIVQAPPASDDAGSR